MRKKLDKIFDNKYEEKEIDTNQINFTIDDSLIDNMDPESSVHYSLLFDKIDTIIKNSEFSLYNDIDENKGVKRLNKVQINKVYTYVMSVMPKGYRKIEIWAVLSEYFDIYPAKFFSSLSNKYKNQLVYELDKIHKVINTKKGIKKMF